MTMRRRLLWWLFSVTLVCTSLGGACMYWRLLDEANELFDYELRTLAIAVPTRGAGAAAAAVRGDPEEPVVIEVWNSDGRLAYSSTPQPLPASATPGYGDFHAQGQHWRAYLANRNGELVQVAQAVSSREEVAVGVALRSLAPFLVLMPILAVLMVLIVGRGLAPLRRLAALVAGRAPNALNALSVEEHPPELVPVVMALNDLLLRLDRALQGQRAFLADAAHELRSPLTALKLQIQLAERAIDGVQRRAAFRKVDDRLERAIHLVQQLLVAARQDSLPRDRPLQRVDLLELAQACIAERYVAASVKGIDLGVPSCAMREVIDGRTDDLQILLGNLIDNAIRYTHVGGWVDVSVEREHDLICLRVMDNGPGIPVHERKRVFGRFYRGRGHAEAGSGLGLAIVAGIAVAHGAAVRLDDNPAGRGLCVTVSFGAVPMERGVAATDPLTAG